MKTGWISTVRKLKNWAFAELQQGNSPHTLPVVLTPQQAEPLTTGSCIQVDGKYQPKGNGKPGQELVADSVKILGHCGSDYPLQKKFHRPEFIRQMPQFRWRTRTNGQTLRYRSWAIIQLQNYFSSIDTFQVNSPILTSSDCEGAGEVFEIKDSAEFFDKPAYLSVSSQLHLEVFCQALARVWNLAPAFRAERSDTNRHLSEFWMIEAELAFVDLPQLLEICENMVKSCVPTGQMAQDLLDSKRDSQVREKLDQRWQLLSGKWNKITYRDALELLKTTKLPALEFGDDIPSEHEKYLAQHFASPVFVTHYPASLKPFYMRKDLDNTVECFDLLVPEIGEIVGGSMREDSYDILLENMEKHQMSLKQMEWYTDLRKYGSFPHGGYGLGFERLIMYVCGLDNIRDASGFIRHFGALQC